MNPHDDAALALFVHAYIDGSLSEAERARWAAAMLDDPALRARVLGELRLANQLVQLAAPGPAAVHGRVRDLLAAATGRHRSRTIRSVEDRIVRRRRRLVLRRRVLVACGLAAGLVLAVLAMLFVSAPAGGHGDGLVVAAADGAVDATGHTLVAGDVVAVGTGVTVQGQVELRAADGTTFRLAGPGGLTYQHSGADDTIDLSGGTLAVEAAPRQAGTLRILGRWADATVIGTGFTVSDQTDATGVLVSHGRVRVAAHATGALTELAAGGRVWAGATGFVPVGCALRLVRVPTAEQQMRVVTEAVRQAVARGASLIVLPATALNAGDGRDLDGIDALIDADGPELKACAALADELDIVLVIGAQMRSGTEQANAAIVFGPEGQRLGEHRKTALSVAEEKAGFSAGAEFIPITTPLGRLGLLISKDVYRDPAAWGAAYADKVDLLVVLNCDAETGRYLKPLQAFARQAGGTPALVANMALREDVTPFAAMSADGPQPVGTLLPLK